MVKITAVWLHGANQTQQSFEYLRLNCDISNEFCVNYSSSSSFHSNLEEIIEETKQLGPVFIIGHSLGGLYGLHLTKHIDVVGGISISTPFGGSFTADWAKYIVPTYQLFRDIGRRSTPVVEGMNIQLSIPWTQLVSTKGSVPYHGSANDGVVTLDSMTVRDDVETVYVPYNHYEVVCNQQVAEIVKDRYYRLTK